MEVIAQFIAKVSGGNMMLMVAIALWISAIASAFVDNIPFAATMIPVIKALAQSMGVDLSVLAWTLAMGTDLGDYELKLQRVMDIYKVSGEEAKQLIRRGDWKRKSYHNYHCKGKWGDSRNYDISVNSSKLGIEKTTDLLECYIKERIYL